MWNLSPGTARVRVYNHPGHLLSITLTASPPLLAPNLHFVAHLPISVKGEQLLAQLFRCIPEHSWLFQYGRVPMSLILTEYVWSVRLTCHVLRAVHPMARPS